MKTSVIYADFNKVDSRGRLRLNTPGTFKDVRNQGLQLHLGMRVVVYDAELFIEGNVEFSEEENIWVVKIDWANIRA